MTLVAESPPRRPVRTAATTRLDPSLHRAVTAVARLDGLTLSAWLARTVERHEDVKRQILLQKTPGQSDDLDRLRDGIGRLLRGVR